MPNLRASHIRRVAQLKTQGADVPEEQQLVAEDEQRSENINHIAQDRELSKAEQNKRIQHAKIDATFQSYQPETDAEVNATSIKTCSFLLMSSMTVHNESNVA